MMREIIIKNSILLSYFFENKSYVLKVSSQTLQSKEFEVKISAALYDLCPKFDPTRAQSFKIYGEGAYKDLSVQKMKKVWPSLNVHFFERKEGSVFYFDELKNTLTEKAITSSLNSVTSTREGSHKVRVLIVDDSATITKILKMMIESDSQLECIGVIHDPTEIPSFLEKHTPDVVTLDIHMPKMNGVECLKKFFVPKAIPAIMVSALRPEDSHEVLDALEAGAVDYFQKPEMNQMQEFQKTITEKIREIGRSNASHVLKESKKRSLQSGALLKTQDLTFDQDSLVLIGSSTGGTEALKDLLTEFPKEIPPVLIVQHIPPVFSKALADRINSMCPFAVCEAKDGQEVVKNTVYIAPGGTQMKLRSGNGKLFLEINDDPPMTRHKPSVDYMFQSVSKLSLKNLYAIMLTGMGGDGSKEMLKLRQLGARTIAQSERTCVVYGMPKEAVRVGAVEEVADLLDIPQVLSKMMKDKKSKAA